MKTKLKKLFLLAIILMIPNLVDAESLCSYNEQVELNNIVSNVKATYEAVEIYAGQMYDADNPNEDGTMPLKDTHIKGFNISILNITEDIYVRVSNNYNDEVKTYAYKDTENGTITFQTTNNEQLITYTIEVIADKYACAGEKFRDIYLTTPIYNVYSKWKDCKENPEFYYCQEFLPSENISMDEFDVKMEAYQEQKQQEEQKQEEQQQKSFLTKVKELYENNKLIFNSIIVVIIIAGVATTVILIKKKRSRVL